MNNLEQIHRETIGVYEQNAQAWDAHRPRVLFERVWLDPFINCLPAGGRVLDVGCGAGEPIARYLLEHGCQVTGLDAAANMLAIARSRFPEASWIQGDMRNLGLGQTFDGIISWDGFFHLKQDEQRAVLPLFADHLSEHGVLLLTIGNEAGEVTGTVEGQPVYHASLAPDEYRSILDGLGFDQVEICPEDPRCDFHTVLLARRGTPSQA